ncbi:secondary thiamine-phosphate synthase enzyme YjbQ [Angustibacter aerolatus]|uniref:Uncharacterized protein n=1 Tax=Angustibacter aerolatus TaxID=1162965 RepID=A0ABQ6JRL6_9ACTN|nr:secondary thiamine-phosphate synthase enzyme YjbQ [Angustibacter aerolatus]GMA84754.1 hypothetical protein GCM10025868_00040 [Angustibacter aerolatus]GMA89331.1 hypothetical protein GCM10025868_45810 [Angustibacter aerolatus]
MLTTTLDVTTGDRERVLDLTRDIERFLREGGARDGLLNVFVPHATAGVAVLETGAGSDDDLLDLLGVLVPCEGPAGRGWQHRHGTPGHGRDHVLPGLVAPSVVVPVLDGAMALGTWQSVVLVDTNVDNPRRTVRLSFVAG